jgi:hypothetical protein
MCTREAITDFGWTLSLHLHYSPDLALSYHLFGPLKKSLRGHCYANDEALQNIIASDYREETTTFY